MINLKPCPFCGKEARLKVKVDRIIGDRYIAQCTDTSCPGRITKTWHTEKAAVDGWNRRVNDG